MTYRSLACFEESRETTVKEVPYVEYLNVKQNTMGCRIFAKLYKIHKRANMALYRSLDLRDKFDSVGHSFFFFFFFFFLTFISHILQALQTYMLLFNISANH